MIQRASEVQQPSSCPPTVLKMIGPQPSKEPANDNFRDGGQRKSQLKRLSDDPFISFSLSPLVLNLSLLLSAACCPNPQLVIPHLAVVLVPLIRSKRGILSFHGGFVGGGSLPKQKVYRDSCRATVKHLGFPVAVALMISPCFRRTPNSCANVIRELCGPTCGRAIFSSPCSPWSLTCFIRLLQSFVALSAPGVIVKEEEPLLKSSEQRCEHIRIDCSPCEDTGSKVQMLRLPDP